jgi:hypothetical protein
MAAITINVEQMERIGENIKATQQDSKLILVIDLSINLGPSSTGKMNGVASTGGFSSMPGGLRGNIYIGKKV